MKDIRIQFDGNDGTRLVLNQIVEGKSVFEQKYLINTATTQGSDKIYPERGTSFLQQAIGGTLIDWNSSIHTGNFAATDTIYFCSYEEHPDVYNSDIYVSSYQLIPALYDNTTRTLSFRAIFAFNDGTSTSEDFSISTHP